MIYTNFHWLDDLMIINFIISSFNMIISRVLFTYSSDLSDYILYILKIL